MNAAENQTTSHPGRSPESVDAEQVPAMLQAAIGQIEFVRQYTSELLEQTPQQHWFEIPDGLPSNIAWQVGHLTVSQYGLLMFRLRGRDDEDLDLIPSRFRKAYSRGSKPQSDPAKQMTATELLDRMQAIHQRSMQIVKAAAIETLLEPIDRPYAMYPNKLGAVLFCPLHEQIHAGQIGLIRRSLGLDPVR